MVSGWFRQFLIMSGKKKLGKLVGLGGFERDNTKAGGRFPRNGKEVVWRASTLKLHMDRFGLYRTRAEQVLGLAAPQGEVVCM